MGNTQEKNKSGIQKIDLGEGSVSQLLFKLALPAIVSQVVNLLYNVVDRIYIGHIADVGALALTGLGLCTPVIMIVSAFSLLIGSGGAPRAAISMGAGDNDHAEDIQGNCVTMLLICAALVTLFVEIFAGRLLALFGASVNTMPYGLSYLRIYAAGTVFVMASLGLNLFITTQGEAAIAMKTVIIGAISNIILDPVFIFLFGMGVQGAALATVISQGISAAWVMKFLTGTRTKLRIRVSNMKVQKEIVLPILGLGISPFIMTSTESLLNIAFNSSLSRYGGDIAVGSMTILASIMQFQMFPVQGLVQGAQPIISFNYGAGKTDRVVKAFKLLLVCCLTYTMVFWALVQLFPQAFVKVFNSDSQELIDHAVWALRIYMAVSGVFGIQMAIQQTFVALGQAKISLFIACLRKIILLIPLIFILPIFIKNKVFAVYLAEPLADFISVSVCLTLFLINIKGILAKAGKNINSGKSGSRR